MPAVSVLMPCYNAAATLGEALETLERQSLPDFEVVAVDDGSTDQTGQILRDWTRRDRRFRILSRPHQGIIAALNAGLAACRAPFVARMDADDRVHPDRLARQVDFLAQRPEVAVAGCLVSGFPARQVGEGLRLYLRWLNSLVSEADIRREIFIESPFAHPSVMFRREWVEQVGGYQERGWAEDYDLWLRLAQAGARFAKVPEFLLEWRESPWRLTRTAERYSLDNFLRAKAFYLKRGPLVGRETVFIWGAGTAGKRLGRYLQQNGISLTAFVDVDPRKVGRTRRGLPVLSAEELRAWWGRLPGPVLIAAVGARGARPVIRERLSALGLVEGQDWWFAA